MPIKIETEWPLTDSVHSLRFPSQRADDMRRSTMTWHAYNSTGGIPVRSAATAGGIRRICVQWKAAWLAWLRSTNLVNFACFVTCVLDVSDDTEHAHKQKEPHGCNKISVRITSQYSCYSPRLPVNIVLLLRDGSGTSPVPNASLIYKSALGYVKSVHDFSMLWSRFSIRKKFTSTRCSVPNDAYGANLTHSMQSLTSSVYTMQK